MAGWLKIGKGAEHAGVSKDTFNTWPALGLRFVKLPSGTRLFKVSWIDAFLENFEVNHDAKNKVDEIVLEVMGDISNHKKGGVNEKVES